MGVAPQTSGSPSTMTKARFNDLGRPPSDGAHPRMRSRRLCAFGMALAVLLLPAASRADIVAVQTGGIAAYGLALDGLKEAYGGKVIVHELGKGAEIDEDLADTIKSENPKVVVAIGAKAATSAKARLPDIPIVFCMVLRSDRLGLAGSNVTGIRLEIPPVEQLRQFKLAVPGIKKVGIVFNPAKTGGLVDSAKDVASELGIELVTREVEGTGDVPDAVDTLVGEVDGLWLVPDATVVTKDTFKHILLATLGKKVPLMVFSVPFVKAGALLGVAPNYQAIGEMAAGMAKSIESGTSPGDLEPRDPPAAIVLNQRTAGRVGVSINDALKKSMTIIK